jgi:hypothetical protein
MSPTHGKPSGDPASEPPADQGETLPARDEKREPKLPHERDESADSQAAEQPSQVEVGEQAHEDIDRGLVDTGRAPVTNRVYKEQLKGNKSPPREKP